MVAMMGVLSNGPKMDSVVTSKYVLLLISSSPLVVLAVNGRQNGL